MPITMPKFIKVCGRRVRIAIESSGLNTANRGTYDSCDITIRLDASLAPDELRAVALHEMIHDCDQVIGIGLAEQDVCSLASVLFGVIRDNPRFIAWLQEKK